MFCLVPAKDHRESPPAPSCPMAEAKRASQGVHGCGMLAPASMVTGRMRIAEALGSMESIGFSETLLGIVAWRWGDGTGWLTGRQVPLYIQCIHNEWAMP